MSARTALSRAALALCLLSAGCSAELQARTVCYTLPDYPILGADASGGVQLDIGYNLGADLPILSDQGVDYTLTLKTMELSLEPGSPVADLGPVETVTFSAVAPAGSGLPGPELVRYTRGADLHPETISAAAENGTDLAPYISSGRITFHAEATGSLPTQPWAATIEACFRLEVKVDLAKQM